MTYAKEPHRASRLPRRETNREILPSGTPIANVRMAEERYRYTDRSNQTQEAYQLAQPGVLRGTLPTTAALDEKGENIFIEGTLQTRQFTPKDGSQRTDEVVARRSTRSPRQRRRRKCRRITIRGFIFVR